MFTKHADRGLRKFSGGVPADCPSSLGGYSIPSKSAQEGGASLRVTYVAVEVKDRPEQDYLYLPLSVNDPSGLLDILENSSPPSILKKVYKHILLDFQWLGDVPYRGKDCTFVLRSCPPIQIFDMTFVPQLTRNLNIIFLSFFFLGNP